MPRNVEKHVTLGASGAVTDVQPRKKDRTITEPLRRLLEQSERLFSQRQNLNSFWQECALNYYPEVATFTGERELGEEYADLAILLNEARGWAKGTLPTYQDRKAFFEEIVNGEPDPVALLREGNADGVRDLIAAAQRTHAPA